ncbi:phosphoribosylaminoimidazole carboxylase, ATPase subunit [Candidatus Endolissoclinum faulkneri L2]|uniref:N5-carboxyaminoimidazole ribonucleotide synthase n=1 Tax=Candidatus Endolissoclinum faulkneri L2 TaxID=1193729 RepID=K7Z3Z7_9PROT|nr:5-(carboxyamino)imidazole ribonucleotide synthase [Candidatus Endolissoclinum faulkneri]AFX98733.1 phosphoribosylaminoimidazole carboxylase, ATPase subunit [Candidatus Endolissoclinum faulkneri L2]
MINVPLSTNAIIGILGAGQLGRMTALAAASLGYICHIYDPHAEDSPAAQVSFAATSAAWNDWAALDAFAKSVDVVTFEFENVPCVTVEYLMKRVMVRPTAKSLTITRHRILEKRFIRDNALETVNFLGVRSLDELIYALTVIGVPAILKTCQFGYDGKSQIRIDSDSILATAWKDLGSSEAILEKEVECIIEVSVIAARSTKGNIACFPVTENKHKNSILRRSSVPANISEVMAKKVNKAAETLIAALNIVGLLTVEFFITDSGRILINELAPRPHNSGHWTMDGCATSQFEQFVRAIVGLPLGSTDMLVASEMLNLIGDDINHTSSYLLDPFAHVHLYGKKEIRPGRKMGHINRRLVNI